MSNYVVWFTKNKEIYRLPVNPEEITETSRMAIEKYNVLNLGQIAVPNGLELREFSFESEFPGKVNHYVEDPDNFRTPDEWINFFKTWRDNKEPVLFTYAYGQKYVSEGKVTIDDANDVSTYVLIEDLTTTEKAGEEGDKYISFKLLEYREFGVGVAEIVKGTNNKAKKKQAAKESTNPKSSGYHIVVSGDSLWGLAKKYYGDGSKCNIIFHANKDKIKTPALLKIGWRLKIPDKNEFSKYNSPLPSSSKLTESKKKELEKMAAAFAAANGNNFESVIAGFGAR